MVTSNQEGMEEFARAKWSAFVRTARYLGAREGEAEDVAQVSLEACFRHWHKVQSADNPDAYIFRTVVNAFRRLRAASKELPCSDRELHQGTTRGDIETEFVERDQLVRALRTLSDPLRQVVVLRFYADLSEKEVARALGIPLGTVKSRTWRGLAALESAMNPRSDEATSRSQP